MERGEYYYMAKTYSDFKGSLYENDKVIFEEYRKNDQARIRDTLGKTWIINITDLKLKKR